MSKLEELCKRHDIYMEIHIDGTGQYPVFFQGVNAEGPVLIVDVEITKDAKCADVLSEILAMCAKIESSETATDFYKLYPRRQGKRAFHKWLRITQMMHNFLGVLYEEFLCAPHRED